jgi:hypothetical protein
MSRGLPSWGKEAFPRRKSRRIGQTPLKTCVNCGKPNDTRTTAWSNEGDGLGAATDVVVGGVTQDNTKDRAVESGCTFCGSTKWQSNKPPQLPDDYNKPSDEWRTYRKRR